MRLAALAAAAVLAACGGDAATTAGEADAGAEAPEALGPTATLARFYAHLAEGDLDAARALMVPLSDPALEAGLIDDLRAVAELCAAGELALEAREHFERGRWACVVTRHVRRRAGAPDDVIVRDEFLLRTSDGWRVASEPMRSDPAIAPLWDSDAAALLDRFRSSHDALTAKHR